MVGSSVTVSQMDSDSTRYGSVEESFISEKGTEKIGVHTNDNNNIMSRHFRLHDILYSTTVT